MNINGNWTGQEENGGKKLLKLTASRRQGFFK